MIFDYNYQLNLKKIQNISNLKNLKILDFGCGKGMWSNKSLRNKKLKKIILYDINKKLSGYLTNKYRNKKIKINFDLTKIQKENYNLVLFSSVIQYIPKFKLFRLLNKLSNNKEKKNILIVDIPFLPRPLELIFMPFFNLIRFIFVLKLFFLKEYKKINYYTYSKSDFSFLKKKYHLKFATNIHDLPFLRYSLFLKLK